MTKTIFLSTIAALCVAAEAVAAPITLPSLPFFKFTDAEQVQPCTGSTSSTCANSIVFSNLNGGAAQGNWGVVQLDQIFAGQVTSTSPDNFDIGQGGAAAVWDTGGVGQNQIFGVFSGVDLTPGTDNEEATGGVLNLYWADSGTINMSNVETTAQPTNGSFNPTVAQFEGAGATGVVFLGQLDFVGQVDATSGNCTTTEASNVPVSTLDGGAFLYANVNVGAGGAWANQLNNAWFQNPSCGNADVRLNANYNANSTWDGNGVSGVFGLSANDPGRAFGVVPEPATLTLLGLGLSGLGFRLRKKT